MPNLKPQEIWKSYIINTSTTNVPRTVATVANLKVIMVKKRIYWKCLSAKIVSFIKPRKLMWLSLPSVGRLEKVMTARLKTILI